MVKAKKALRLNTLLFLIYTWFILIFLIGGTYYIFVINDLKNLAFIPATQSELNISNGVAKIDKTPCFGKCTNYHKLYIVSNEKLFYYHCPLKGKPYYCLEQLDSLDNKTVKFSWAADSETVSKSIPKRTIYSITLDNQPVLSYQGSLQKIQTAKTAIKTRLNVMAIFAILLIVINIFYTVYLIKKDVS